MKTLWLKYLYENKDFIINLTDEILIFDCNLQKCELKKLFRKMDFDRS